MMRPKMKRVSSAIGAVLISALALSGCGSNGQSTNKSVPTTLTLSNTAGPATYDPYSADPGFYAFAPAYDTILHVDGGGKLQPWLAKEWKFLDPTTLELSLRDDVTFADGTPFNAEAMKANIEYGQNLAGANEGQASFKAISKVEIIDNFKVHLVLAAPNPDFPYNLAQRFAQMVSPKALATPRDLGGEPAGSGPYTLDKASTRSGVTYTWVRNANYWNKDAKNIYPFDKLTYKVNTDPTAATNAARAKEVDFAALDPGQKVNGYDSVLSTSGPRSGFTGVAVLDLNGQSQKALADPKVRQAMNYAVDRKTIVDSIFEGSAEMVPGVPVLKGSPADSSELNEMYPFDPAKAKQLLAEAGYPNGFPIRMTTTAPAESFAQAIAGYLRQVGIQAELGSFNGAQLPQELKSGNWNTGMFLRRPSGGVLQDIRALYSKNSFYNIQGYQDPQLTKMLDQAAATLDDNQRTELYKKVATYAAEQSWFIGTVQQKSNLVFNPANVSVNPAPFGELWPYMFGAPKK